MKKRNVGVAKGELHQVSSNDKVLAGSVPQIYQQLMVPLIFAPYARDLAARILPLAPLSTQFAGDRGRHRRRDPELAATTARRYRDHRNRPQRADAGAGESRLARSQELRGVRPTCWRRLFDDASFDVVACQFGVMFFPDRVKGHAEARRVLTPRRPAVLQCVGPHRDQRVHPHGLAQALAETFPDDPPRFMARTPHGYHDPDLILQRPGTRRLQRDRHRSRRSYQPRALAASSPRSRWCQGTPMRGEIEARGAPGLQAATDPGAEQALAQRFGKGAIEGPDSRAGDFSSARSLMSWLRASVFRDHHRQRVEVIVHAELHEVKVLVDLVEELGVFDRTDDRRRVDRRRCRSPRRLAAPS